MKYVVIGPTLSGNKGAAAMFVSTVQTLSDKDSEFVLFSYYPNQDKKINNFENTKVINAKPLRLALVIVPLAMLWRILPPLRRHIEKVDVIKQLSEANVYLDQGGITFSDGRELFLIYNVATILPAIFMKVPIVKCAQALGPFKNPINKLVSKIFLPRIKTIVARGEVTKANLDQLKLKNVVLGTDIAFMMNRPGAEEKRLAEKNFKLSKFLKGEKLVVGISPSIVVKKKVTKQGLDHDKLIADIVKRQLEKGRKVILIPHSYRTGTEKLHNNDGPLVDKIAKMVDSPDLLSIDKEIGPMELKYIIGQCDAFLACRFHAMISSLSMAVPTLVLGWSHKYAEILDLFGYKNLAMDFSGISVDSVTKKLDKVVAQRKKMHKKMSNNLSRVKKLSRLHIKVIKEAAR